MSAAKLQRGLDAERTAELERELDARSERLPGSVETSTQRRTAFEAFKAHGFPSRRDEDWRYTDLKPIAAGGFDFATAQADGRAGAEHAALESALAEAGSAAPGPRVVFVDGRVDARLSRLALPAGLELIRLAEEPARFAAVLRQHGVLTGHPLGELNTAFADDGITVRAAEGSAPGEPLHLYFLGSASGLAEQPRVSIELAPRASLTVVVQCLDVAAPASWLNVVTQVSLAEGARLSLYRLQEHGAAFFETSLLTAELAKNASLEVGYVDLGGRLVRNDIDVKLREPGAHVSLFGVFLAGAGRHIDNHTKIDHLAPDTTSDETFRGIADRDGHGVFNGKVIVHPGAQRIQAHQSSDNLLLADRAEIDTKPELEIYADDVKCSHGATIGELDSEQLFYLRARGVDEPQARALLTFAFAASVLERLQPAALK
ncbi:MAG TPA: Fe-S cluster assembly protein SufD, partial [Gammaproteobacteria bacterium]|nr:Fe-S cluster assembly protein SufD [Gammaproteobacteria bacterium]